MVNDHVCLLRLKVFIGIANVVLLAHRPIKLRKDFMQGEHTLWAGRTGTQPQTLCGCDFNLWSISREKRHFRNLSHTRHVC